MTFLHRRGLWMCELACLPTNFMPGQLIQWIAFYWASTAGGATGLLVAVPFIVQSTGANWRTNYWFWSGFSALSLLMAIFLLPETLFARAPALIDGQQIVVDDYGNVTTNIALELGSRWGEDASTTLRIGDLTIVDGVGALWGVCLPHGSAHQTADRWRQTNHLRLSR